MMKSFYNAIEEILLRDLPLLFQTQQLRYLLRDHLALDEFKLACVEETLRSIQCFSDLNNAWNAPHFFYHPSLHFSFRMICWPAFYENNPHQHKTWSVTGIIHNQLEINTYTLLCENQRLRRDRTLSATSNDVGYLMPGCIHSVNNPSHELSASLHIFNNLDASNPEENAIWYPSPRKFNLANGLLERTLTVCLRIASHIRSERAFNLINQIYQLSPFSVKLMAIQAMYSIDQAIAKESLLSFIADYQPEGSEHLL